MTTPADAFQEARERHAAAGEHGPRWVPLAAAILAVLAAVSGFVANTRAAEALNSKNDAIIATTRAADTYNEYEARSIKEHIYQAAIDAGTARNPVPLRAIVVHERAAKVPVLRRARAFEADARRDSAESDRLLAAHEVIEIATTLFEVAIVLVSITALVGSRLLPIAAGAAAACGLVVFALGAAR